MTRILRGTLYVKLGLLVTATVVLLGAYLRLVAGPVNLDDYAAAVEDALSSRIGPGWSVKLGDTALELFGAKPAVRTASLEIRNPSGVAVVRAPYAIVSLDPISLLTGSISPREIELRDLQIRATISSDGGLSFAPSDEASAPAPEKDPAEAPPAPTASPAPPPSVVSAAVASLLDPLVRPTGLIGALDRATVRNARLTLVGPDGRERVAFDKVAAAFERVEGGDRRLDLDLIGPRGEWTVRGRVGSGPDRPAEIEVAALPLADLMLLSGLSGVPIGSDLTLSGRLTSASRDGRLSHLEAHLESSQGSLVRDGYPPIVIGRASAQVRWDEARSALGLEWVEVRSQGTNVRLSGELRRSDASPDWRLALAGRDIEVAGLTPRDPSFRIATLDGGVTFGDAAITVDRTTVRGEGLDAAFAGTLIPVPGNASLHGVLDVRNSDVRKLVRLWPDTLNPDLRGFLAASLGAGRVESLRLAAALDPPNLRAAFSDTPFTEGAIDLQFRATGAELSLVDELPPIRGLLIEGRAAGTRANLEARGGTVTMPDGRSFSFPEGSFVHKDIDKHGSAAQIAFRVGGGADALASFLRTPMIRELCPVEVDPSTVSGAFDLRVRLPLVPSRIPKLSDLPLSMSGTFANLAADKLPGQEKLEGANVALTYEAGLLSARGEGRLSGTPATFEMQAARSGQADLTVTTVLDDAARARRSLPGPPALAGPIPLKITVDLARRSGARVGADLGRASIDGLVPGWVKPPARPGRLAFTLADADGHELRDVVVDAGPVQIRGSVTLSSAGGVERADLPTFRLSPGDDLRAQLDRGPGGSYRVSLKGNNADARPLLKWIGAPPPPRPDRPGSRDAPDLDLDVAFNILSGFNDEAMTGVSAKVSSRAGELRSLQFGGRFRAATIEAQLAKRDAGAPIATLRSGDAGATLRFLDLYRRMIGGRLTLDGRSGDNVQQGRVTVEDFGLRNEPALARIVSQAAQSPGPSDERGLAPIARAEVDQVLFNKLQADFRRSGSRIDYSDAVIYGPQVGFSLSGFVDHARDRLDIVGTFVPAYALNNVFSQLPVVGILLGGGRNEGLFAVDFKVSGALSSPTLAVNPLTAIAPGIVRKLFGWMLMPDGAPEPEATSSPGPAAPPASRRPAREGTR